ncbi:MAG TPA: phosphoribosylaminoimidazolesuccinocarboxamide synthase [Candidatus Thiothrix moscowensis]|uniref:phosphoribosylaminoimidazolesuccinocarboxamide synthase n=1 Tax=unclassified Thiothrix TaxID=2636184 RepID=UPI001A32D339|nr:MULTISPECIES: phosphoribosylaminoimidazolesuccinocarboxamide synthase [unclassified Thiothrix]MBJ6608899.1 phosphoribosylaminoimidazolesuccinocarboxamide synthase [Candidatus Thiothrix moscowensis]HRJ51873.1 phosphoribosylaminoimidazolesuccinocarboxamide synthase [Candidatus Thiothrix moscowensis]HRJ92188.1 phosphoribosylaminoimidazolesuccinocarboxamide synthase [Candidatus Thiothrix moscowensis]
MASTDTPATVFETQITSLPLIARGKVRDIYAVDAQHMLIVTTDRLSAFDVIMPDPIPQKGVILTQVANFWFALLSDVIPNHLSDKTLDDLPLTAAEKTQLHGRSIIVKRMKALPVEAIVRGYLIGSGWKDYQQTGAVCGISLPAGLQMADRLPAPIFTPSTKADVGTHDINISFAEMQDKIGTELAEQIRSVSLELYNRAAAYALQRGIIIADTKFEFGLDADGKLVLIDEILTPDSSRFWPADQYQPGISPPSFDKQFVRDYLETLDWGKTAPGPELPTAIREKTAAKYREVADLLMK